MQKLLTAALVAFSISGCSSENPLIPAASYRDTAVNMSSIALFDPAEYAGRWYEIASYPVPFQQGCTQTQAVYTPRSPGVLDVRNSCLRDGKLQSIAGEARLAGPGRLAVSFDTVPFLTAPYWVLWVDEGYRTAVVGVPSGRAGWILNRDPQIPDDRLEAAKEILLFNGYDLAELQMTPQVAP
ncbi:lipocalin family protein [Maribius pontilimi]|uniref:Outer membrane lipoprotein Blc n=1 Tax=Palleronia pontilimi TaxID=1964209 RepID=A0A934II25_9RHOB|nr:lipocalin family protein [Palleronia pontilimi]MBJ3763437.1 lipocalin family protein [Palleronia pontilimi]